MQDFRSKQSTSKQTPKRRRNIDLDQRLVDYICDAFPKLSSENISVEDFFLSFFAPEVNCTPREAVIEILDRICSVAVDFWNNEQNEKLRIYEKKLLQLFTYLKPFFRKIKAQPTDFHYYMIVSCSYNYYQLASLLNELGVGINFSYQDSSGKNSTTPLICATCNGQLETVDYLIKQKADVNLKDSLGTLPLFAAATRGFLSIVKLLVENGADINMPSPAGPYEGQTPLASAVFNGHSDVITYLIQQGANFQSALESGKWFGMTPLFLAAVFKRTDIVELLLEKGCDCKPLTVGSYAGETPLGGAIINGSVDVVRLFLQKGFDLNSCLDKESGYPLYLAALTGDKEMVELLLNNGQDINYLNRVAAFPESAGILSAALTMGNQDLVNFLIEKKASIHENEKLTHDQCQMLAESYLTFAQRSQSKQLASQYLNDASVYAKKARSKKLIENTHSLNKQIRIMEEIEEKLSPILKIDLSLINGKWEIVCKLFKLELHLISQNRAALRFITAQLKSSKITYFPRQEGGVILTNLETTKVERVVHAITKSFADFQTTLQQKNNFEVANILLKTQKNVVEEFEEKKNNEAVNKDRILSSRNLEQNYLSLWSKLARDKYEKTKLVHVKTSALVKPEMTIPTPDSSSVIFDDHTENVSVSTIREEADSEKIDLRTGGTPHIKEDIIQQPSIMFKSKETSSAKIKSAKKETSLKNNSILSCALHHLEVTSGILAEYKKNRSYYSDKSVDLKILRYGVLVNLIRFFQAIGANAYENASVFSVDDRDALSIRNYLLHYCVLALKRDLFKFASSVKAHFHEGLMHFVKYAELSKNYFIPDLTKGIYAEFCCNAKEFKADYSQLLSLIQEEFGNLTDFIKPVLGANFFVQIHVHRVEACKMSLTVIGELYNRMKEEHFSSFSDLKISKSLKAFFGQTSIHVRNKVGHLLDQENEKKEVHWVFEEISPYEIRKLAQQADGYKDAFKCILNSQQMK